MFKIFFIPILLSSLLFSHPHTFIDVYPTVEVKNHKITTIHFKWILDEMTSSMLIMEFDQNGDLEIDRNENHYAYKNYFLLLENIDFYTEIRLNDKLQAFPKPINFKATIENNRVCYSFDIAGSYDIKDFKIDFGDPDFFVAMVLKKEFINAKGLIATISDVDNDFYFTYRIKFKENS